MVAWSSWAISLVILLEIIEYCFIRNYSSNSTKISNDEDIEMNKRKFVII